MTTATATDFRQQRDALKVRHKADTAEERRALTDQIETLMRQVRRTERSLKLAADLPPEKQPAELRTLTDQVVALRAKRAPMLRPEGLEQLAEKRRAAEHAEQEVTRAELLDSLALDKFADDALVTRASELRAQKAAATAELECIAGEQNRRAVEAARSERYKGMTREQKLAELEALKREVGGT